MYLCPSLRISHENAKVLRNMICNWNLVLGYLITIIVHTDDVVMVIQVQTCNVLFMFPGKS